MRLPVLAALALAASFPTAAPAADHSVTSVCHWVVFNDPGSFDAHFFLVVEAHASGPTPALTTRVSCTATNAFGEESEATGAMPGNDAYYVSSRAITLSGAVTCSSSQATWVKVPSLDHVDAYETEHCDPIPGG